MSTNATDQQPNPEPDAERPGTPDIAQSDRVLTDEENGYWDEFDRAETAAQNGAGADDGDGPDHDDDDGGEGHGQEPEPAAQGDGEAGQEEPQPDGDAEPKPDPMGLRDQGDAQPDIWAEAPEHLREAFKKRDNDARTWRGRFTSLNDEVRQLRTQVRDLQNARSQPAPDTANDADQKKATNAITSVLEAERWKQVREEYPELMQPLEEALTAIGGAVEEVRSTASSASAHIEQQRQIDQVRQQEQRAVEALSERHPDWQQTVRTPEYRDWIADQSPYIQRIHRESTDADEVSVVLDLYRAQARPRQEAPSPTTTPTPVPNTRSDALPANRRRQMGSGFSTRARGRQMTGTLPPADDGDAAWDYFERAGL